MITSELQILVRGEMSVRCSPRRCGSPVHVDVATDDMDDLSEAMITEKLKKASGANYDLGSNAGGASSGRGGPPCAPARKGTDRVFNLAANR